MKHVFLFVPKEWKVKGNYTDENGRRIKVEGFMKIAHKSGNWAMNVELVVPMKGGKSLDLRSVYKVKPVKKGGVETSWTSENKITGKCSGRFFVAGPSIISTYTTKNNQYAGFETFKFTGGGRYENEGAIYQGTERVSSWKLSLY